MPANDATGTFGSDIAAAVRAEFGRQNKRAIQLVDVLTVSRPTAYDRYHGRTPFTADELDKVASFLGISAYDLVASAETARPTQPKQTVVIPVAESPVDVMAQPARATRSRRGAA